jgi:hypothetical protein
MSAAHTPAPWAFERAIEANGSVTFDIFNSAATEACNRSGECVAYIHTYSEQHAAVQEANARLIAAAPRMFAALIEIQARLMAHPAYLDLRDSEDCDITAEQLELASIVRVAREAAEQGVQP